MGIRLKGFDYKRPYYYMVTIKRRKELAALSAAGFANVIARTFGA